MNELREQLAIRMINIYGFEHPTTIAFIKLCEKATFPDKALQTIVNIHEEARLL